MTFRKSVISLLTAILFLAPLTAYAHKESDAYVDLRIDPANAHILKGQWDIALRDLNFALDIDSNHDGNITWGEVQAHRQVIDSYALRRLKIKGDGLTCKMTPTGQMIDYHTDGAYDVIKFHAVCDKEIPDKLTVVYNLFYNVDPYHRGIITIHAHGRTAGAVLGPKDPTTSLNLNKPDRWRQFKSFVVDGIWHIWTGIDHLLFVLSLLLPSVLIRKYPGEDGGSAPRLTGGPGVRALNAARIRSGYWEPVPALWPAFVEVVKVITAFTISHSVTLSLAVLGIVDLPSRLVESGIALSVIVAALNNIYPVVRRRVWLIAFTFGFIHGLGFASALSGLQLPPAAMAASLGGFNVGVEIGQETIVLAFMPLAFLLRHTRFYRKFVLIWGSMVIITMATGWLIQRAFNVLIPGVSALLPK